MILWQKKSKCGLSWSVLLSTTSTRHKSAFPKQFFVLFMHVERRVWESFWNESLTRTSSSFPWCSACTFKSESVFSVFTNLDKDFCRYLWYCGKKKETECCLAWHWWNSTYLGLIDMFLSRNCRLYIIIQKIALQAESGKYFQIWFSPWFGAKNGGVLSMRTQVILDSLFARPGSAPIWGGKKGEFRDWTNTDVNATFIYYMQVKIR